MKTEPSSTPNDLSEERVRELIASFEHCVRYSDRNPTDGYAKDEVMISRRVLIGAIVAALRREPMEVDKLRLQLQSERDENFTLNLTCTQLGDERDALAADAIRYRWLLDSPTIYVMLRQLHACRDVTKSIDECIDAAIGHSKEALQK